MTSFLPEYPIRPVPRMSKIHKNIPTRACCDEASESSPQDAGDLTLPFRGSLAHANDETKTVFRDGRAMSLPADTAHHPTVGSMLVDRYQLEELIGVGGMSCVYKAVDLRRVEARSQNPYLAVKVLTVPCDHYSDSMQALEREAHKLQSLSHPNIVRVIDIDRDNEAVFMTMEYLSGASLQTRLASADETGYTRQDTNRIITSIASALEFAHRAGIVHGDLKPANVIITATDEVKVIDFGISRFFARHQESSTEPDAVEVLSALTPPYASPEMLEEKDADPRDDVYALACMAHELLTGLHPFGRMSSLDARAAGAKLARHSQLTPCQYSAIARGLAFERARRTPSAREFIDEFSGKSKRPATLWLIGGTVTVALIAAGYFFALEDEAARPRSNIVTPAVGQVFRDCPTCPLMSVVPSGTFIQGSAAESAEQPPHPVNISAPIAFAPREITIGEFKEFAADVGLQTPGCNVYDGEWRWRDDVHWDTVDEQTALHPVTCVSW
ncbi:MAG: protein kinase, partial [Steroidobacter sp.]